MPAPRLRWRHIIANTHRSWLPGYKKGFRNRDHRIHSSGDYANPPPKDEHDGLLRYNFQRAGSSFAIARLDRAKVGRAVVKNLLKRKLRVLAVAVSSTHLHIIVELPDDVDDIAKTIGWCKWHATRALGANAKAQVWAEGETKKPIDADDHLKAAYEYVWRKQGPTAWAWSFREGERDATR